MAEMLLNAAEDALQDTFQTGFESTNDGMKNPHFCFVKSELFDLAFKEELYDLVDRNIEKWPQLSSFMNVFARRALTSTQVVSAISKFIREKVEEQAGKVEGTKEIAEVPFSLPSDTPSSYEAPDELEERRRGKKNRDVMVEKKVYKYEHRHEGRKYSSLFGTSFMSPPPSPPSSETESFLTCLSREINIHSGKTVEQELPVLRTAKKNYVTASDYCTY